VGYWKAAIKILYIMVLSYVVLNNLRQFQKQCQTWEMRRKSIFMKLVCKSTTTQCDGGVERPL
jgi:hypothetical protein